MISVRNVVSVDFDIIAQDKILGDFETTVYFAPVSLTNSNGEPVDILMLTDVSQIEQVTGNEAVNVSIRNYFENGGVKLLIVSPKTFTLDGFIEDIKKARNITNDFIYICVSNQIIGSSGYPTEEIE